MFSAEREGSSAKERKEVHYEKDFGYPARPAGAGGGGWHPGGPAGRGDGRRRCDHAGDPDGEEPHRLAHQLLCAADRHRLHRPLHHPAAEQRLPDAGAGTDFGLHLLGVRRTDVHGRRIPHHPPPVHPARGRRPAGAARAAVRPSDRPHYVRDVRPDLLHSGGPGRHLDPRQGGHAGAGGVPEYRPGGGDPGGHSHSAGVHRLHLLRSVL